MNLEQLLEKFNAGINWNAYLYAIYKISSTLIIILLYYKLDAFNFSVWANINSIIFMLLLWADFGLRKSIPRYCPEFLKNAQANKRFTKSLIVFQLIILILLLPLLLYFISILNKRLAFDDSSIVYLVPIIFLVEGIISVLRLVYHAHFKQRYFNLLSSCILMAETVINAILIFSMVNYESLVFYILANKCFMSSTASVILLWSLPIVYRDSQNRNEKIDSPQLIKDFITHSGVMWITTSLRSLSERNFMVPFLTYTAGPLIANTFKVANDGALIFQRIVLKTIGTTDTSLLSYVQVAPEEKKLTDVAFKKLATKMAALCLPFLGFIGFIMIMGWFYGKTENSVMFQTFSIISISYLLEALLLPYERILEVKRAYRPLIAIYFFYSLLLLFLVYGISSTWIGLRLTIALLCCVRLVSMLMMSYAARSLFNIHFPFSSFFQLVRKIMYRGIPIFILIILILIYNLIF